MAVARNAIHRSEHPLFDRTWTQHYYVHIHGRQPWSNQTAPTGRCPKKGLPRSNQRKVRGAVWGESELLTNEVLSVVWRGTGKPVCSLYRHLKLAVCLQAVKLSVLRGVAVKIRIQRIYLGRNAVSQRVVGGSSAGSGSRSQWSPERRRVWR